MEMLVNDPGINRATLSSLIILRYHDKKKEKKKEKKRNGTAFQTSSCWAGASFVSFQFSDFFQYFGQPLFDFLAMCPSVKIVVVIHITL